MCNNLIKAVKRGSFSEIKQLVKGCTLLDSQEDVSKKTALHYAFQKESYTIAKFLLKHGARSDIKDASGVSVDDVVFRNRRMSYQNESSNERETAPTTTKLVNN